MNLVKTLADAWRDYRHTALSKQATPSELGDLQLTFYAGALAYHNVIRNAHAEQLERLRTELLGITQAHATRFKQTAEEVSTNAKL